MCQGSLDFVHPSQGLTEGCGNKEMCFTETTLVPCVEGHPRPEVARGLLQWSGLGVPCTLLQIGEWRT